MALPVKKVDGHGPKWPRQRATTIVWKNTITGILLCFRRYEIGIAGDISKMFLRVLLDPDDCKYQGFLWSTNEDT